LTGWGENDRGTSFTFGADVVTKFLNKHDLDLICRAHQVMTYKNAAQRPVLKTKLGSGIVKEWPKLGRLVS
jgi:serine/threonine-protein phosphatase PP1 catalytic subunit